MKMDNQHIENYKMNKQYFIINGIKMVHIKNGTYHNIKMCII